MRHAQRSVAILIVLAILLALPFTPFPARAQVSGAQTVIILQVGEASMMVNGVTQPSTSRGRCQSSSRAGHSCLSGDRRGPGGQHRLDSSEQKVTIIMVRRH